MFTCANTTTCYTLMSCSPGQGCTSEWVTVLCQSTPVYWDCISSFVGVFIRSGISNSTHTSSCFADSVSFLKTPQGWFSMEKFRKHTNSNYKEKYCKYKGVALHSLVLWILFIHAITFPFLSIQWSTMWSLFAKGSTGHYISLMKSTILAFLIKNLLFAHMTLLIHH